MNNIQLANNLAIILEKNLAKCSHKHNKKDLKILNESCDRLRDKLVYEYDDNEHKAKIISSINCTQKNIENILEVIEKPESELNKCTVCDKKIRFQMNKYKMEEFIDWTSLLEDINYLDKDLENVQLEELLICLLYTSPSPRDRTRSRMPSSA